jgi:hypothetical protein
MRPFTFSIILAAAALMAVPTGLSAVTEGTILVQDTVKLDTSKVRYGDHSQFDSKRGDKVGTVRSTDVYEAIPAYKTIKKEGVTQGSARWEQLMQEATSAFKSALRTVASNQSLVLIVEEGGISGYSTSDVTSSVISSVGGLL